jgi:hypothetical protein
MATPQAAVAMVAGATLTAVSYKVPNVRCILWIFSSIVGMIGAIMVHVLDVETQRNASLAGVYLMGFYNVPWVFMLSLSSSNVAGATKKSFMGVSIAIIYGKSPPDYPASQPTSYNRLTRIYLAVGNIVGPQFFLQRQAPHYVLGIGAMLTAFAVMAASGLAYYMYCFYENKRRDRLYGDVLTPINMEIDQEVLDRTDRENQRFRYIY